MAVKAPVVSTLNPHAPLFIPAAYMDTEDFSPEWWCLVENCPAFRDYWLRENQGMEEELGAEDLEVMAEEMELIEEEEEVFGDDDQDEDGVAMYSNNDGKENKEQDQCLARDLRGMDLNRDKDDSPELQDVSR